MTGWFFQGSDNLQVVDEEKCNGCGICANACHEGAIDIVDGKAKLVRENFCGGLQRAAENAIRNSGKFLPWQVVTISRNGEVFD